MIKKANGVSASVPVLPWIRPLVLLLLLFRQIGRVDTGTTTGCASTVSILSATESADTAADCVTLDSEPAAWLPATFSSPKERGVKTDVNRLLSEAEDATLRLAPPLAELP